MSKTIFSKALPAKDIMIFPKCHEKKKYFGKAATASDTTNKCQSSIWLKRPQSILFVPPMEPPRNRRTREGMSPSCQKARVSALILLPLARTSHSWWPLQWNATPFVSAPPNFPKPPALHLITVSMFSSGHTLNSQSTATERSDSSYAYTIIIIS